MREKTCAEQVQERYQSREDDFVKASEFYDKYEEATEGEQIALETFYEDVSGYEDFFDFIELFKSNTFRTSFVNFGSIILSSSRVN